MTVVTLLIIRREARWGVKGGEYFCVGSFSELTDALGLLLKGCAVCGRGCDGDGDRFYSFPRCRMATVNPLFPRNV